MVKKLISLASFSKLAGVSRSAVTQAADTILKSALVGKRIDVGHPAAVEYIKSKQPPVVPTIYDEALYMVSSTQAATVRGLTEGLRIPQREAQELIAQLEAAGAIGLYAGPGKKRAIFVQGVPRPEVRPHSSGPPPVSGTKRKAAAPPGDDLPTYAPGQDLGPFRDMTLSQLLTTFGTSEGCSKWLASVKTLEEIEARQVKNAKAKGELISRDLVRIHIFGMIDNSHKRLLTDEPRTLARRMRALAKSGSTLEEMEQAIRESLSKQLRNVKATATRVLKK